MSDIELSFRIALGRRARKGTVAVVRAQHYWVLPAMRYGVWVGSLILPKADFDPTPFPYTAFGAMR
jgi:hypothetical protein